MEIILFATFLVRYIVFIGAVALVGVLVASSVFEIVRNKVLKSGLLESDLGQKQVEGKAL